MRAFQAATNQAILTRGIDSASFATFIPITPRNEETLWRGKRLSAGRLIAKSPEVEYYNQTARDTVIRALLVPVQTIRDATSVLTGDRSAEQVSSWTSLEPSPRMMARLEQGLASLLSRAIQDPTFLGSPEGYVFEHECLRRLVECLADPSAEEATRRREGSRSILVRRAVDFIHDRLGQPLTAFDLCAELEVSDRTLRRAFAEVFGMGPVAYVRAMRLHAVRAALREARGSHETVANVARRRGFSRLGSFAAEYRRQFGEYPSETLGVRGWPGVQRMTGSPDPFPKALPPGVSGFQS